MTNYNSQARRYLELHPTTTVKNAEWKVEEILRQFCIDDPELQCDSGWIDVIYTLHEALLKVYPEYKVYQIKEKFGLLRFYLDKYPSNLIDFFIVSACMEKSVVESSFTCERCGAQNYTDGKVTRVKLRHPLGWMHTYCDECELEYIQNHYAAKVRLSQKEISYKEEILNSISIRNTQR